MARSPREDDWPVWYDPSLPSCNDDFAERVVLRPDEADWRPTRQAGLEIRVLERPGDGTHRLTAQLRLAHGTDTASLGTGTGVEMLVQHGDVDAGASAWPAGLYVRLPAAGGESFEELIASGAARAGSDDVHAGLARSLLYVTIGRIAERDTEQRRIDTNDASRWLPGPVTGTEVMPLHGHGSANVMLIRWCATFAFRPRLDPLGEEVLVLKGCLHDALGSYPAGSWIRNPVPAWQSWSGDPGTVVYYKNGHFTTAQHDTAPPDPTGE